MYGKLFSSLYQGTLRGKASEILVLTNLIAFADQDGVIDKHFRAIADETGLSEEAVRDAIEYLSSPDPESRSSEEEGRRIVPINEHRSWGWQLVNHAKYKAIRSEADRRESNRTSQQRYRDKLKAAHNANQ